MALTQSAVVKLILQYIGGAKINGSSTTNVDGKPVIIRSASLQSLADKLGELGESVDDIRNKILQNPKALIIAAARKEALEYKAELLSKIGEPA